MSTTQLQQESNKQRYVLPRWLRFTLLFAVVSLILAIIFFVIIIVIALVVRKKGSSVMMHHLEKPLENIDQEFINLKTRFDDKADIINPTIFVAISSFRDPELVVTLNEFYNKAYNKQRIIFGVVQQNDPQGDDPLCFAENSIVPKNQLRVINMHYKQAKGPTYARSICESLFQNEDYYMMCDSHMRAEAGWDVELIDMVLRCPRPKRTVITMYPEGFERIEDANKNVRYEIKQRKAWRRERFKYFNQQGIVEFESVNTFRKPPDVPEYVPFWAACFAFGHSDWVREVPFHNNTPYLFFGEEILMTARLFAKGWDLRGPRFSVVYHLWKRGYRKTFWEQDVISKRDESIQKVKDIIMGVDEPKTKYSLGNKRTVQEFWDYIGLNPHTQESIRPREPWTLPENFRELHDEYNEERKYIHTYETKNKFSFENMMGNLIS